MNSNVIFNLSWLLIKNFVIIDFQLPWNLLIFRLYLNLTHATMGLSTSPREPQHCYVTQGLQGEGLDQTHHGKYRWLLSDVAMNLWIIILLSRQNKVRNCVKNIHGGEGRGKGGFKINILWKSDTCTPTFIGIRLVNFLPFPPISQINSLKWSALLTTCA